MKKVLSILIVNILCLTAVAAQENVSDIRVELRDTLLNVTYNLQQDSKVEIYYSSSDGAKYIGPLKEVTGDCGEEVKAGEDRVIVWNPVEEVGYIEAPNSVIKIVADAIPEPEPEPEPEVKKDWGKHNLLMVGASLIKGDIADTPISLMYGRYRHFGWYIKAESDLSKQTNYNVENYGAYGANLYSDSRTDFAAGKLGFLWNINNRFVINIGAGVQFNKLFLLTGATDDSGNPLYYEIEYPNYQNEYYEESLLSDIWEATLVGEIGVTYNWRRLSIGVNVTPNFNRFVGYEGMGAEEYIANGTNSNYTYDTKPIYKTKLIASVLLGINF